MMKRVISIFLVIVLFAALPMLCHAEGTTDDPSIYNGCHSIDAAKTYLGQNVVTENIKSAFLYELSSQSLLYAWNADLPQYPASLVKIMTALLVLENSDLSDVVTVSQNALDSVSTDAISVDLVAGEQMTVENLLYCLMVKSANDAAAVLAEYISGSQNEFVVKMNARALELGCTGTTYINPHGLHDERQVTTARDICRVLQEALKHETFRSCFGTVHYTVPATNLSEERLLSTNNYLMSTEDVGIYLDSRVTGGRTGITSEGFRCIASTGKSGNMEVICIVMGCKSTFDEDGYNVDVYGGFPETIELYNLAFENNDMRQIIFRDQIIRQQPVLNGECDVFAAAENDVCAVLPSHYTLEDLTFLFSEYSGASQAPITKGQKLGTVQVMYGSSCVAQTQVYAANDVAVAVSKAGNYINQERTGLSWWMIPVFLILIAGVIYVIRLLYFRKRTKGENNRRRRY